MNTPVPTAEPPRHRLLHVRLKREVHETIRHLSISQRTTNAGVITWAIELLDRYVQAGGER